MNDFKVTQQEGSVTTGSSVRITPSDPIRARLIPVHAAERQNTLTKRKQVIHDSPLCPLLHLSLFWHSLYKTEAGAKLKPTVTRETGSRDHRRAGHWGQALLTLFFRRDG